MRTLTDKELMEIKGGASISGSLIASFAKGFSILLDLGRSLGTAIRRVTCNQMCNL